MSKQYHTHIHSCNAHAMNHMYDHNPPAYYGTDNHPLFIDVAHTKVSVGCPGIQSGLYRHDGPLCLCPTMGTASILTNVECNSVMSLKLKFTYTNSQMDKTVSLEQGKVYTIDYIEDGNVKRCTGLIDDIYKIYNVDDTDNLYKIRIDCSQSYSHSVVIIKNDQIRDLKEYVKYADEDTTIDNSSHKYGTTVGFIKDAIITNATLDKNHNLIDGTIVDGEVHGYTSDGLAYGTNSSGHNIYVKNGQTYGGRIIGGMVLNGIVRSGDIDGEQDDETLIIENATVKGMIDKVVIVNSIVEGGKTSNGVFVSPTITNSIVVDGQITGDDMITTGGITAGDITTGGTTTGGTITGGTATGIIDDNQYNIEDGTTTVRDGEKLVTVGGVVTGGTIVGGTKVGSVIIGATVIGGVCTGGTTTGGTTTGGTLVPVKVNETPITKPTRYNPEWNKVNADNRPTEEIYRQYRKTDDLIVWTDQTTMHTDSNLGDITMERVDKL